MGTEMKYVFISHKNAEPDRGVTNRLYHYLTSHNLGVWYDAQLRAGDWPAQLSIKLHGATAYILVASKRSLAPSSYEVTDEVGIMRDECKYNEKKIIILALDDYVFHLPPGTADYFLGSNRNQAVLLYNYASEEEAFEQVRLYLSSQLEEFENNPADFIFGANVLKKYNGADSIVVVPSFTEEIAEDAFSGNDALLKVVIPASVRCIGRRAFFGCSALTVVEGMEGVCYCDCNAFDRTPIAGALKGIKILNGIALGRDCEGDVLELPVGVRTVANRAFICSEAKKIVFPEGLVHIGASAFRDCYNVEALEFPKSLQRIGKGAFYGCFSLKKAVFHGELPPEASGAFDNISPEEAKE